MTEKPREPDSCTRRSFLKASGLGVAGLAVPRVHTSGRRQRETQKLRLGFVGVWNRGAANVNALRGEELVALCDVDAKHLARARERFAPRARGYRDYREMLDAEKLDALVISTPDHMHAPVAAQALRRDLHVYVEKPLAHSVHEVRVLTELARERRRVTQMGTQMHARANYRRVIEILRSGALGEIEAAHAWCPKDWGRSNGELGEAPVPEHLDWDLWLGAAPKRPYTPGLHPIDWRRHWDFGGGTLSDMACHYLDLVHWALDLAQPEHVEALAGSRDAEWTGSDVHVRWRHPATQRRGAVEVHWYDGKCRPTCLEECGLQKWSWGILFVGTRGWIVADYDRYVLGPQERFGGFEAPPHSIPRSRGHHREWAEACRNGWDSGLCPTGSNFDYAGPLTETVLLGIVALRSGEAFRWDAARACAVGAERAQKLLAKEYREGHGAALLRRRRV